MSRAVLFFVLAVLCGAISLGAAMGRGKAPTKDLNRKNLDQLRKKVYLLEQDIRLQRQGSSGIDAGSQRILQAIRNIDAIDDPKLKEQLRLEAEQKQEFNALKEAKIADKEAMINDFEREICRLESEAESAFRNAEDRWNLLNGVAVASGWAGGLFALGFLFSLGKTASKPSTTTPPLHQ